MTLVLFSKFMKRSGMYYYFVCSKLVVYLMLGVKDSKSLIQGILNDAFGQGTDHQGNAFPTQSQHLHLQAADRGFSRACSKTGSMRPEIEFVAWIVEHNLKSNQPLLVLTSNQRLNSLLVFTELLSRWNIKQNLRESRWPTGRRSLRRIICPSNMQLRSRNWKTKAPSF